MATASRFDGKFRWLHTVRLYPTYAQERAFIEILRVTRELYNAMLQQRRDYFTTRGLSYSSKQQYAEITELRACEPRFAAVYRECEDATLHRLDLNFAAFFRRLKSGETLGTPASNRHAGGSKLSFLTVTAPFDSIRVNTASASRASVVFGYAKGERYPNSVAPSSSPKMGVVRRVRRAS
jgi:putative transposase